MPRTTVTAVATAFRFDTVITFITATLSRLCATVGFVPRKTVSPMTASSTVVTNVAALRSQSFAAADCRMTTVAFVPTQPRFMELLANVDLFPEWIQVVFDGWRWYLLFFWRSSRFLLASRRIQHTLCSISITIQTGQSILGEWCACEGFIACSATTWLWFDPPLLSC